jgi:hypothetical protein
MTLEGYPTIPAVTISSSPPANPVAGQEWILPVASGLYWRFVYSATQAAIDYGWIFVGGSPLYSFQGVGQIAAGHGHLRANTWFDIPSDTPPQLSAVPRAGIYLADTGAQIYTQNTLVGIYSMTQGISRQTAGSGAFAPTGVQVQLETSNGSSWAWGAMHNYRRGVLTLTAGDVLKCQYTVGTAALHASWGDRFLQAIPARVS